MSLPDVVLWLFNTTAFTFAGVATSWGEIAGFVTGKLCVWLVARHNPLNWPIGILNNLAFLVLFATSGLYADSGLQVVYVALALYGWRAWLRAGVERTPLPVGRTTRTQWWWLLAAGVAGTLLPVWVLTTSSNSTVPWAGSVTTVLSLLAMWGQIPKKGECFRRARRR